MCELVDNQPSARRNTVVPATVRRIAQRQDRCNRRHVAAPSTLRAVSLSTLRAGPLSTVRAGSNSMLTGMINDTITMVGPAGGYCYAMGHVVGPLIRLANPPNTAAHRCQGRGSGWRSGMSRCSWW
jgi:hypothetical protein